MAYTTINKSTDYFNTVLYTGTGSSNSVTGVGFRPDWLWIKNRSTTSSHIVQDVVRGATKQVYPDLANAEVTGSDGVSSFDSDGFTVGTGASFNGNGNNIVAWNWLAGGSQGSANTDGSTNTTYTSVNTTAGFSISKWTPSGSAETVGHGLGVAPKMIITKNLGASQGWFTYHHSIGATKYLLLNDSATEATGSTAWNDTAPTSSVFSVGSQFAGSDYIAYCFAEKIGFSKFGSYVGNGNDHGSIIYTGFKPAWFMVKCSTYGGQNWIMFDNKRDPYNEMNKGLRANTTGAEDTSTSYNDVDFLSNGIKIREDNDNVNRQGETYIYMAFAEAPLVGTNNIPATAR